MNVETVRVKSNNPAHEGGFVVINKADFDAEVHELFDEPKAAVGGWGAPAKLEGEGEGEGDEADPAPVGKPAKK